MVEKSFYHRWYGLESEKNTVPGYVRIGDTYFCTDSNKLFIWYNSKWNIANAAPSFVPTVYLTRIANFPFTDNAQNSGLLACIIRSAAIGTNIYYVGLNNYPTTGDTAKIYVIKYDTVADQFTNINLNLIDMGSAINAGGNVVDGTMIPAIGVIGTDLYILNSYHSVFKKLDTIHNVFSNVVSTARNFNIVKSVNNKLYAFGVDDTNSGHTQNGIVTVFDPVQNNWTNKTGKSVYPLNDSSGDFIDYSFVLGNLIYIQPFQDGNSVNHNIASYDTVGDSWTDGLVFNTTAFSSGIQQISAKGFFQTNGNQYFLQRTTGTNSYIYSIDPVKCFTTAYKAVDWGISNGVTTEIVNGYLYIVSPQSAAGQSNGICNIKIAIADLVL